MTDPKETREWGCTDDSPHCNGYTHDERRGPYYGRVSWNDDEVDEDGHFEGSFNDEEDI